MLRAYPECNKSDDLGIYETGSSVLILKFLYKSERLTLGLCCGLDEASDGIFEFLGVAVNSAPELLFGERGEPSFHWVEP